MLTLGLLPFQLHFTDDGVDAETSLSLSLHFYLSSPPLHFFLALTIGHYILFENACELQRVVFHLEEQRHFTCSATLFLSFEVRACHDSAVHFTGQKVVPSL